MAVTLTKEFWTNFVLFVLACVALGLSIWAFVKPCKKDGFGELKNVNKLNIVTPLYSRKTDEYVDKDTLHNTKSALYMEMLNNCENKPYMLQCYDFDSRFSVPNDSVFYNTDNSLYKKHIYSNDYDATTKFTYYSDLPCSAFLTIS